LSEPGLYVVAAPSGGGKTSLIAALLERDPRVRLSVSHTTRAPRPGEQDGVHYHFVNEERFLQLVSQDAFLEHARVFDHYYGTGRAAVEQQLAEGCDVVLDIDWQGARQVRQSFPACRSIFIVPPSLQELHRRLTRRGQDNDAVIRRRMRDARNEISHWDEFDFLVINDEFDDALADLQSIIRHGRAQRDHQREREAEILAELLETG
jgi:guanylate kinase